MFERCIYFNLSVLNRRISKIWQDEFGLLGLSPSHGYLLVAMTEKPSATQKELSEIMELDASTITRFIDALSRKKLVERTSVGKGAKFILTVSGIELAEKIKQLMGVLFSKMQSTFGESQFDNIVDGFQQTRMILDEKENGAAA